MKRIITYILYSCAAILTSGCGDSGTGSEELRTGQLQATFIVNSSVNNQAEFTASFKYLSDVIDGMLPVYEQVRLEGQDKISVETTDQIRSLDNDDYVRNYIYTTQLTTGNAETEFTITFSRPSKSEILTSIVTLASPMEIVEPAENQVFSVADSINFSWAPVIENRTSKICIKSTCYRDVAPTNIPYCVSIQENGKHLITASDYFDYFDSYTLTNQSSCTAKITLVREQQGNISSGFSRNSRILSQQERSRNITFNLNE